MSDVVKRKLASIQRVMALEPIEGADRIEKATVLGWHLVVQKGEFKVGSYGVYFEIDSLLPDIPAFAFLKDPKGRVPEEGFVHRLKTKKLKGVLSQGLLIPLDAFKETFSWVEGTDVTEMLGVKKYEPPVQVSLRTGQAKSTFPGFIPKTDEIRVQSIPWIVDAFMEKKAVVYITLKVDGTSVTYYIKDGEFGVCSRNQEWKKPVPEPKWRVKILKIFYKWNAWGFGTHVLKTLRKFGYLRTWQRGAKNTYWEVAEDLQIEQHIWEYVQTLSHGNWAIQGEICGPGIQKNRLGLTKNQLFIFDIYNIDEGRYLNYDEQQKFVAKLGLQRVPDVGVCEFCWSTVDELVDAAKGKYPSGHNREGIVIRTTEETVFDKLGRGSFKVINNDYLLKEEE